MDIRGARCGLERSSNAKRLVGYCLIVLTLILTVVLTSCGAIPGGKECDATVNRFMLAAAAKDIDTACTLIPEGESEREDLEEFILNNYELFEGCQEVKMRSINVQFSEKGDTAEYGGKVEYIGGFEGWVEAELVKLGEEWKLTSINVEVSPEKLDDYNRRHGSQ